MKCSFLDYVQRLMISQAGQWTQTPYAISFQPKNEMLIFGLHSTFDFQLGWLMDSNPICPLQYKESWILSELQLFQFFPTEVVWNGQFHPICNFSNLFPQMRFRMTRNSQFCPICNFSNLFPLKWLR